MAIPRSGAGPLATSLAPCSSSDQNRAVVGDRERPISVGLGRHRGEVDAGPRHRDPGLARVRRVDDRAGLADEPDRLAAFGRVFGDRQGPPVAGLRRRQAAEADRIPGRPGVAGAQDGPGLTCDPCGGAAVAGDARQVELELERVGRGLAVGVDPDHQAVVADRPHARVVVVAAFLAVAGGLASHRRHQTERSEHQQRDPDSRTCKHRSEHTLAGGPRAKFRAEPPTKVCSTPRGLCNALLRTSRSLGLYRLDPVHARARVPWGRRRLGLRQSGRRDRQRQRDRRRRQHQRRLGDRTQARHRRWRDRRDGRRQRRGGRRLPELRRDRCPPDRHGLRPELRDPRVWGAGLGQQDQARRGPTDGLLRRVCRARLRDRAVHADQARRDLRSRARLGDLVGRRAKGPVPQHQPDRHQGRGQQPRRDLQQPPGSERSGQQPLHPEDRRRARELRPARGRARQARARRHRDRHEFLLRVAGRPGPSSSTLGQRRPAVWQRPRSCTGSFAQLLQNYPLLQQYHIIFVPCSSDLALSGLNAQAKDNVRTWVENGGKWYVSDWSNEFLERCVPAVPGLLHSRTARPTCTGSTTRSGPYSTPRCWPGSRPCRPGSRTSTRRTAAAGTRASPTSR